MGVKGHRTEYGVRWLEREIGASRGVVEGRRKTLEGIIMDEWPTRTACKEWATSATSLKIDEDRVKSRLRELTQRVVSTFSDDVWLQRKEPDPPMIDQPEKESSIEAPSPSLDYKPVIKLEDLVAGDSTDMPIEVSDTDSPEKPLRQKSSFFDWDKISVHINATVLGESEEVMFSMMRLKPNLRKSAFLVQFELDMFIKQYNKEASGGMKFDKSTHRFVYKDGTGQINIDRQGEFEVALQRFAGSKAALGNKLCLDVESRSAVSPSITPPAENQDPVRPMTGHAQLQSQNTASLKSDTTEEQPQAIVDNTTQPTHKPTPYASFIAAPHTSSAFNDPNANTPNFNIHTDTEAIMQDHDPPRRYFGSPSLTPSMIARLRAKNSSTSQNTTTAATESTPHRKLRTAIQKSSENIARKENVPPTQQKHSKNGRALNKRAAPD
ncbi:hypothetical protein PMZ80_007354 [Knufia obscura]|uniref:Uncharacterized protein n=1 Tax=Knufia obscura TaxID=1635080 RepID=A0ABR0RH36_9EURO|nr:hypothetical protein PMZ80_007354 [Knufia obscura]